MRKIRIQKVERKDDVMVATVAVMEGENQLFGRSFSARSKQELDGTIANLHREVNTIDDEIAKVTVGEWTPPTPPAKEEVVAKEPTAEELKAQEIAAKEMELEQEVERARREREVAELAQSDTGVAERLAELEALRNKK